MSASPHAGNPDRRPLPDGWITRYDEGYRAWYYVDTRAQPPRSSWDHPLGAPPPPTSQPGSYPPPSSGPPSRNYPGSSQPYNQPQGQSYPAQSFNQASSYPSGGYQGNQQDPRGYPQQGFPPQQSYAGQPAGNYNPGWQQQQQGWQQQPQQGYAAQQQQPGRGSGGRHGLPTGLLAGGAGLVGGVVLAEAYEHHERREDEERQEVYDQGYVDGEVQDNNANFDDGGGAW